MTADLEKLFQALGDRTRLRLLNLMAEGEICVCFFVEVLDQPQPTISRHLAYLRRAGLVAATRDGKWMSYSLTPPDAGTARQIFDAVIASLAEDRELRRDRERLLKSCCSPRASELLKRAPRPGIAGTQDSDAL